MINDKHDWSGRSGANWALEWRRTDRGFTHLTARLLERIDEHHFVRAVDVGCGAGEISLAMARGAPEALVSGVDVSADLVEVARRRAQDAGLVNTRFVAADAADWQPQHGAVPDLIVSRHGVMFFDDPPTAFGHLAQIAAPGAALVFSCFRSVSENPFFTQVAALLPAPAEPAPPPGPGAPNSDGPGPFAFADPERVAGILEAGGWTDVAFEPVDFAMIAGAGDNPVTEALAYWSAIGPAAHAIAELGEEERSRFVERLRELAEANCAGGQVSLSAACWIVSARAG